MALEDLAQPVEPVGILYTEVKYGFFDYLVFWFLGFWFLKGL